jgi:nucleoside-diphosphate-sugar epimerase
MAARERFLVTGGAGFIGRHLCAELAAEGHSVRIIDDLSRGDRNAVPMGCEWIEGSVGDLELCREACQGIDGVFHLAAAIDTPVSVEAVDYFMRANANGTRNVLVAARDAHVQKVVYGASRTAYGAAWPPHSTSQTPDCLTPYALSKLIGEQLCLLFTRLYGVPTVSLRYADVYGAGQPTTGPYAVALAELIAQRRAGRPLSLHGDRSQEFDFVHVSDVVAATIRAYRSGASGLTLNVGSGQTFSIKSITDLLASDAVDDAGARLEGNAWLAAIAETEARIRWSPRVSLAEGLHELLALRSECPTAGDGS